MSEYEVIWRPTAMDQLAELAKEHPEAPGLIVPAVWELATNPRPSNSTRLGTSRFRRLLLGFFRVTYEVVDEPAQVEVYLVGRAPRPR